MPPILGFAQTVGPAQKGGAWPNGKYSTEQLFTFSQYCIIITELLLMQSDYQVCRPADHLMPYLGYTSRILSPPSKSPRPVGESRALHQIHGFSGAPVCTSQTACRLVPSFCWAHGCVQQTHIDTRTHTHAHTQTISGVARIYK